MSNLNNPATQSTAAYTNEMDPSQSTTGPTAPYTSTETTTTTHTSRAPHSSTAAGNTTAGPFATSGGTVGNERVESGQGMMGKIKGAAAAVHGTGEALRGAFNTSVDKMAGDVRAPSIPSPPFLRSLLFFCLESESNRS